VDAVVGNTDPVSDSQDVSDGHCSSAEALAQFEYSIFEIVRILCVAVSARRLQLWYLAEVTVFLGELLHSTLANLKLLGDQTSVHAMINNSLTNPGDIVLVKFHFT